MNPNQPNEKIPVIGNISQFYKNTENLISFNLINLQEVVANRAAKQLWGNGFHLTSEDENIQKIFDKLQEDNDLLSIFYAAEKLMSVYGVAIFTIDKTENDSVFFNIAQPYAQSRVARVGENEISAFVIQRYIYYDTSAFLKTTYTKNDITREWLDQNYEVVVESVRTKLDKKYKLIKHEVHNYGFIPVMFFQNLPKKNFYGDSNIGNYYPDNTPVKDLQLLLNASFNMLVHELRANRTRVFGKWSQQEIQQALTQMGISESSKQNVIKNVLTELIESGIFIQSDTGIMGDNSKTIEMLIADPKFSQYIDLLVWIQDQHIKGCGYSSDKSDNQVKTAFELNIAQSDDLETSRMKRNLRQHQYKRMIDKLLVIKGIDNETIDFSFEIKENNIIDRTQEITNSISLIQSGLSTREREIKRLNGITEEEAIKIKQEIDQERDSERQIEQDFINENNIDQEENKEVKDNEDISS